MILGAFVGEQKSNLVFLPEDQRCAKNFVELAFDS